MKTLSSLVLLCLALTTACLAQTADEKAVAAAVENLRTAMISASQAELEALTADTLLYIHSSGKRETRADFIATLTSGRSDFVSIDFTDQVIKVTGDTAIVSHKLAAKTNDGGKPGTISIGIMLVWQKQNDQWKLLGRQAYKL